MRFFLVGPTAVGKTALAIELAEQFDAEIVNADAFQIYRGLEVLTAKPDAEFQRRVCHHLLGQISLTEIMSAAKFRELALAALDDIRSRKKNAIVVGGSGLAHGGGKFAGAVVHLGDSAIGWGTVDVNVPDSKKDGDALAGAAVKIFVFDDQYAAVGGGDNGIGASRDDAIGIAEEIEDEGGEAEENDAG